MEASSASPSKTPAASRASSSEGAALPQVTLDVARWLWFFVEALASFLRRVWRWFWYRGRKRRALLRKMDEATSCAEWRSQGALFDRLRGTDVWREVHTTDLYDVALITARLAHLKKLAQEGDISKIAFAVRAGLLRNYGGIGNPKLFGVSCVGTKHLIHEYQDLMLHLLDMIWHASEADMSTQARLDFFHEAQQSFGRTALVLSGGAAFGLYHLGVVKALYETHLLPRVIAGSSVGSIIAAIVGVTPDEHLPRIFEPGALNLQAFFRRATGKTPLWRTVQRRLARLWQHGALMDVSVLDECARDNIGDITFEEAFVRTGRLLNIMVTTAAQADVPRLLNHLTAPHVLIRTAACASMAVPGLYEGVQLLAKNVAGDIVPWSSVGVQWADATSNVELPVNHLAQFFNVNHFVVSQVSPYVVPFLPKSFGTRYEGILSTVSGLVLSEIRHRLGQLAAMRALPRWAEGVLSTLVQMHKGDVVIVPDLSIADYKDVVAYPTNAFVQLCTLRGERATWPKIAQLDNHMCIEIKLDDIVNEASKLHVAGRRIVPSPHVHTAPANRFRSRSANSLSEIDVQDPWTRDAVAPQQLAGSRIVAESPTRVVVVAGEAGTAGDRADLQGGAAAGGRGDDDVLSVASDSSDALRLAPTDPATKGATSYRRRSLYY